MNFLDLATKRYSVRNYTSQKVEEEKLAAILEAGRIAPTASNRQPLQMIVAQSDEGLEKLKRAAKIFDAPLAIIISADHEQMWKRVYDGKKTGDIDASIVTTHMMLQAAELGLGTVWICHFNPEILKQEFNIPAHIEPINILVIGYAAENDEPNPRHFQRKAMDQLVSYV